MYMRYTNTQGNADEQFTWGESPYVPVAGNFGTLNSGVTVNVSGAPDALKWAVESLYQELPSAPHLPERPAQQPHGHGRPPEDPDRHRHRLDLHRLRQAGRRRPSRRRHDPRRLRQRLGVARRRRRDGLEEPRPLVRRRTPLRDPHRRRLAADPDGVMAEHSADHQRRQRPHLLRRAVGRSKAPSSASHATPSSGPRSARSRCRRRWRTVDRSTPSTPCAARPTSRSRATSTSGWGQHVGGGNPPAGFIDLVDAYGGYPVPRPVRRRTCHRRRHVRRRRRSPRRSAASA